MRRSLYTLLGSILIPSKGSLRLFVLPEYDLQRTVTDEEFKAMKERVFMDIHKALLTTLFGLCLVMLLRSTDKVAYRLVKLVK